VKIESFNKNCTIDRPKYKKSLKELPRQMLLTDKRKKIKSKTKKTDLLKSFKRKKIHKNEKRMMSSKSTGLKSSPNESPTKTIKYK